MLQTIFLANSIIYIAKGLSSNCRSNGDNLNKVETVGSAWRIRDCLRLNKKRDTQNNLRIRSWKINHRRIGKREKKIGEVNKGRVISYCCGGNWSIPMGNRVRQCRSTES